MALPVRLRQSASTVDDLNAIPATMRRTPARRPHRVLTHDLAATARARSALPRCMARADGWHRDGDLWWSEAAALARCWRRDARRAVQGRGDAEQRGVQGDVAGQCPACRCPNEENATDPTTSLAYKVLRDGVPADAATGTLTITSTTCTECGRRTNSNVPEGTVISNVSLTLSRARMRERDHINGGR